MTETIYGAASKGRVRAVLFAAASLFGCAATDDNIGEPRGSDESTQDSPLPEREEATSRDEAAQGDANGEKSLSVRLYARQELKIRGSVTGESFEFVAPTWAKNDEHPDPSPTAPKVTKDGRCSLGYERSSVTVRKTSGHGNCSFLQWASTDRGDCSAVILMDPSAGGDNIWNGQCIVEIQEKPVPVRAHSCLNRCGQYNQNAACQCDRACEHHGDCCVDIESVCFF